MSDSKLARFIDDSRAIRPHKLEGEAEVSLLEILKLKLSGGQKPIDSADLRDTMKSVDKVLEHLDGPEYPPLWYTDENVQPGRWVQFDTEMQMFWEEKGFVVLWSDLGPGPTPVLVLHGSLKHLVPEDVEHFWRKGRPASQLDRFWLLLDDYVHHCRREPNAANVESLSKLAMGDKGYRMMSIVKNLHFIESLHHSEVGVMAGFAIVTGVGKVASGVNVVFASSLYVEKV